MLSSLTIPSSCFTQTWVTTPPGDYLPGLVVGDPYDADCFPVSYGATVSPAQCPNGYSSACAPTSITIPGEMVYDCCPNGYSCDGGFFKCTSAIGYNVTLTVTDLDGAQKPTLVTSTTNGMNAHSIRVRYAISDLISTTMSSSSNTALPSSTMSSSSNTALPSSTMSIPISTSSSTALPGGNDTASGALSTGAKAGIGIGAALGGLVVVGAIWVFLRRRNQKTKSTTVMEDSPHHPSTPPPPPLPPKHPSELSNTLSPIVHEMDSPGQRFELPSTPPPMR